MARLTLFLVAGAVGAAIACSDAAKPLGSGDMVINDTAGEDAYTPPIPAPPSDGGEEEAAAEAGYAPVLSTCASCSCDPARNYCFSGGIAKAIVHVFPAGPPGFGESDGAAEAGPPPPPCSMLPAGSLGNGCTPLPAACAATPTCPCLVEALQSSYACVLNCTPTPGFLEVYCPGGAGGPVYSSDAGDSGG